MLIERQKPLKKLIDLAEVASCGRGTIALVRGEAGIGKTSILQEMRFSVAADCNVMWGNCDVLFTPRALGPIHDMAGALGSDVRDLLANGAHASRLFVTALQQISASQKTPVLVFEDVHRADLATLNFLKFIGRRIPMLKALVVMSFSGDEVSDGHPLAYVLADLPAKSTVRIDLQPLSSKGLEILGAHTRYSKDALYTITRGNPFFATEVLACLDGSGSVAPTSIRDAVGRRIDRLAPSERRFIETMSVIPGSFSPRILHPLFGESGETLAMACIGRGLLKQDVDHSIRFRHELAREATLSRVSPGERRKMHSRVLNALLELEDQSTHDILVHHAAGAMDAERVLEFAPKAASISASVGAHREAAALLAIALRFVDNAEPELAAELYDTWAYEAGFSLPIADEVIDARRHAITLWRALGRIDKVGDNLRWLARLHWYRGESDEAERLADEAVRVLDGAAPSSQQAMAYSLKSQLHLLNDKMDDAVEWGERALNLAEKFDATEARIHALNNVGTAHILRDKSDGIQLLEESLALSLANGHDDHVARAYISIAEYAVEFKDFALAEKMIGDGIAYDTQYDLDECKHRLAGRFAQLRMEQGRLRDAETIAEGVLNLDHVSWTVRLPAEIVLARIKLRLGDSSALQRASQALREAVERNVVQHIIPAYFCLIEAAWLGDEPDTAIAHLQSVADIDAAEMHKWNAGELALWSHRVGFKLPESHATKLPAPHAAEIRGDSSGAAAAWEELGAPYDAAMALLNSGGDTSAEALTRAIKLLEPLEARAGIAKVRKLANSLGLASKMPRARRGPYKSARHHPLGLTKREQDVLRELATGATNREISETLNRSPRTVEHHVSSVLAKLGVSNRMEAMLRVQSEPWLLPK